LTEINIIRDPESYNVSDARMTAAQDGGRRLGALMQSLRMTIVMAAALTVMAAMASPADAARRSKGARHHAVHSIDVPHGFGTGALMTGPLAGPHIGLPFGYGYDRFEADFYAYTHGYLGTSAAAPQSDQHCARRYRSYDPASGTYLARSGVRRSCP
jgi:hypothetical protein